MSFHQALDLILELDEATVGCTRDILRQTDCLDRLSEIPWVVLTFVVIEGEVFLYNALDSLAFLYDATISGRLGHLKRLSLDVVGHQDVVTGFASPSCWKKKLARETSSSSSHVDWDPSLEVGSKPIASLIAKGILK
ncbi:hypothetical protein Tco_1540582 [Tanacetum coccineum]